MDKETVIRINTELDEALVADGCFITITRRENDTLRHFQARIAFRDDDILPSLSHITRELQTELGVDHKNSGLRTFD